MRYELHLTCVCGHYRHLPADAIPDTWLDSSGLNVRADVFDRMLCLACGRRGRPFSTVIGVAPEMLLPAGWR